MKNSKRCNASFQSSASWLAAACLLTAPGAAIAQTADSEAADADNEETDRDYSSRVIVVTGTNLAGGIAPVGADVIAVDREALTESAPTSVFDQIQNVPQIVTQGVSDTQRVGAGGQNRSYASSFNLRGLGDYSTLTLFNGGRFVQSNVVGGATDPNAIPTIAVQRVEVLADGASAIYGSDAVAGVVNIITRRRFEGLSTQFNYGFADNFDSWNVGAIAGSDWGNGRGNITAAFEYSGHSNLLTSDRDFARRDLTANGGGDYRVNQCNPGNLIAGGVIYPLPGLEPGAPNLCDNDSFSDLVPNQERISAMLSATYEVTNNLEVRLDGYYTDRKFTARTGAIGANLVVPESNAYYMAPDGVSGPVTVAYSFGDQALNPQTGGSELYQLVGEVDWMISSDWNVRARYGMGKEESIGSQRNGLNNAALAAALASSDPATALNPFTDQNSQQVLDSLFDAVFDTAGTNKSQQATVTASGRLFNLPGGEVQLAIGAEHIYEELLSDTVQGTITNPIAVVGLNSRKINSVFGEVLIPVFGSGNAIPGFERLELSIAGRHTDYSDIGTTTDPKIGVTWEPVGGLTLRGTYGTSFRAPNLSQIYAPVNQLYVFNYPTPDGVVQGVSLSGYQGGNPLVPESATTWTVGADFEPESIPGLRASVTYFDADYSNQVSRLLTNFTILQNADTEAQYSESVVRGDAAAALVQSFIDQGYPVRGVLPADPQLFIYGQNYNAGRTKAAGFDVQLDYTFGDFQVGLVGSRLTRWDTAVSPTAPLIDNLNTIFTPPKLRGRARFAWKPAGGFDFAAYVNHTGSYLNPRSDRVTDVRSNTTLDLHFAYTLSGLNLPGLEEATIALDGRNVFDRKPPFVDLGTTSSSAGGFDPTIGDSIGRRISVTLSTNF